MALVLKEIVKSQMHRDIIKFFHENQSSIDTARGISTWIRQERAIVKKVLDELVALGILEDHQSPSTVGYSYTRDKKLISQIGKILKKLS